MQIIKYENRKLYAKDIGYLTEKQVYQYVKTGGTVKVTCAVTRLDVTDQVLKNCLKYKLSLSADALHNLIKE